MTTEQINTTRAEDGLKKRLVASLARRVVRYTCFPSPYYSSPRNLLLHDFTCQDYKSAKPCPASILMTVVTNRRAVPVTAVHVRMRHARPMSSWYRMAHNASKLRVVSRNLVAVGAHRAMVRNAEPAVLSCR